MGAYRHHLPEVFPYLIQIRGFQIEHLLGKITGRGSFALTMEDAHKDLYNLWVSSHAMHILDDSDCLLGVYWTGTLNMREGE